MKHRSSEPGASTAPVSQFGAPLGRTLIFWLPKTSAMRLSPKTSRRIPSTRTYQSAVASTSLQLSTTWSIRFTAKAIPHATVRSWARSPLPARWRQHVVSLLFRCAVVDHGARRQAGQRAARVFGRRRDADRAGAPWPAGGVPRRRLAPAVARRTDPVVHGAPGRGV